MGQTSHGSATTTTAGVRLKKFEPQTPRMPLGLTDYVWLLHELLLTPAFPPAGAR